MKVAIFGAGAWGTAMAVALGGRHEVTLWSRDPEVAAALARDGRNERRLPGFALPRSLKTATGTQTVARLGAAAELCIVATPMAGLREMLVALAGALCPVVWLSKGVEPPAGERPGRLGHEILAEVAPALRGGVLSGPSFAREVAQGRPTALVAASRYAEVREALVAAVHGGSMRVYASDDITGVEVGGAVKNVLAIATGLCDGLSLGLNARAALITRGLAEMTRLGVALGARPETFMGLSGLGDLVLTATGDLSRNRQVGLLLAQGRSLDDAVGSLGHVAEGVLCARAVVHRARSLGIDMPISRAVVALLDGEADPAEVVTALMAREARAEGG